MPTLFNEEKEWIKSLLHARHRASSHALQDLFKNETRPPLNGSYGEFLAEHQLEDRPEVRLAIGLALLPHIDTQPFTIAAGTETPNDKGLSGAFGLRRTNEGNRLLPTGETLLFLLAGHDVNRRLEAMKLLLPESELVKKRILYLDDPAPGDTEWTGLLQLSPDIVDLLLFGKQRIPVLSANFPAKVYTTELSWNDMVFSYGTKQMVEEVKIWLKHHRTLFDDLGYGKRLGKGYKALFHGPPGNGKSVTAALLGQFVGKEVLRIDLSMVVSKYVGETEKNLKKVFDRAERLDAILFFDEADALFGKRTAVKDAHDRYANQEVNYLLQRIEAFTGIVLLATNFKSNLDDAFSRRFQTMVYFPMPEREERLQMWRKVFSGKVTLAPEVKLEEIAEKYSLSFAQVANVGAWCALMALNRGDLVIDQVLLRTGLARELAKESRTL